MDSLPKTPSEKIQKNKLREDLLNHRTWDRLRAGIKLQEELARQQRRWNPSELGTQVCETARGIC